MKRLLWVVAAVCATAAALTSFAAQSVAVAPADLIKQPAVKAAIDIARTIEPRTIEDQVRFCEIPAPPFKERARGEMLRQAFQQAGLRNVRFDSVGNVLAVSDGQMPLGCGWNRLFHVRLQLAIARSFFP